VKATHEQDNLKWDTQGFTPLLSIIYHEIRFI
jgi:hypothetical protein